MPLLKKAIKITNTMKGVSSPDEVVCPVCGESQVCGVRGLCKELGDNKDVRLTCDVKKCGAEYLLRKNVTYTAEAVDKIVVKKLLRRMK